MKISIKKQILENILINTQSYLEKRDLSQITSHLYLKANEENLYLKASDYEIGLSYTLNNHENLEILDQGQATANGKKILDIVKILKDEDIILETIEEYLYIKQGKSKYKLPMFNVEDFPEFPNTQGLPRFEINSLDFINSICKVTPVIDTNNPKYELNGALIDIKTDYINIIGTDTKRLACSRLNKQNNEEFRLIIPKKAILEMQKLFENNKIEIFYNDNMILANGENFLFYTKLLSGKFPEYKNIISRPYNNKIDFLRSKMIENIKKISIVSSDIKITFKSNEVIFESLNSDNTEAKSIFEFDLNINEEITIQTRCKFLIDFLSQTNNENFSLYYNEPTLPFKLESENLITIIMPMAI